MYEFVDRPVARLCRGSRFALWAMRLWTNAARRDLCPRGAVAELFAKAGAAAALADFDEAMAVLRRAPGVPIAFAPLGDRRIAEGEAVLLALWAMLGQGKDDLALATLRLMIPAAAAHRLIESLAAASDHLRQAQLSPDGLANIRAGQAETNDE